VSARKERPPVAPVEPGDGAEARSCEIALILTWSIGVIVIGGTAAMQYMEVVRAHGDTEYMEARTAVVATLILPMAAMVAGVLPIKSKHRRLSSPMALFAFISSMVFLLSVLALVAFEDSYYPGGFMSVLGTWAIPITGVQICSAWSVTSLASRE
jgi:hypothetical protein